MHTRHRGVAFYRDTTTLALVITAGLPGGIAAQEPHTHDAGDHAHAGLHFTHPLFTESVSPDTKLRLDYGRHGDPAENEMELEGELAFSPAFSIEAGVHYHLDDSEIGDTHVILKLASAALADAGVHLGYGLEVGIPTGPEHEHAVPEPGLGEPGDSWEVAPFVNAGWTDGTWEVVGWSLVGVPTDDAVRETAGVGFRFNGSALFHASDRLDALLEAFGATPISGSETEPTAVSLAPGLRVRPGDGPLVIGAGVAFPVAGEEDHARFLVSLFYHF
jgi:hypothetical protein